MYKKGRFRFLDLGQKILGGILDSSEQWLALIVFAPIFMYLKGRSRIERKQDQRDR